MVEDYDRLEEIGKGSFGCVYKIRRKKDQKIMCWKELDYGRMKERERQQVVAEVNIIEKLSHPNIVKYYDRIVDKIKKRIYIIMEYCENGDLASLLKKCKRENDWVAPDKYDNSVLDTFDTATLPEPSEIKALLIFKYVDKIDVAPPVILDCLAYN